MLGTVSFSAIRSNPHSGIRSRYAVGMQYAVGTLVQKRSNPHSGVRSRYAVHSTQYALGVSAERSTHTVDLANMGGGAITFSTIRSNPHSGVCSRYAVNSRYAVCSRC